MEQIKYGKRHMSLSLFSHVSQIVSFRATWFKGVKSLLQFSTIPSSSPLAIVRLISKVEFLISMKILILIYANLIW